MQQVREHIRENEDLMNDFIKIIREIENAGDPKRHPDTRKEEKTKKKVELRQKLVDLVNEWERDDNEDNDAKVLYEICEQSDVFKKELVDYLITLDTLPFIDWYWRGYKYKEALCDYLEISSVDLEVVLVCARFFCLYMIDKKISVSSFVFWLNNILKRYNLDFKI